jgi:hypothetical protein
MTMSAEIEKFYTLPQFLSVEMTFLCQAALAVGLVRLVAYGRPGGRTTQYGLFMGFLLLWYMSEILLAVAPSAAHLRGYLYAASVLPLMPILVLTVRKGAEPASRTGLLFFPTVCVALLGALFITDRATGLVLGRDGLFDLPSALPVFWIIPSAAITLAACSSFSSLIRKERGWALDVGLLLAYGTYLASRLAPSILPLDPFVILLPVSTGLMIRGVEVPMERMLPVSRARAVMRCLPESVLVYNRDMTLAGHNGGPLTGLLADCATLGNAMAKLRAGCSRWTLDDSDEQRFADPAPAAAYEEWECGIDAPPPDGPRDYRVSVSPVRDPKGFHGCILVLHDVTAHRRALRRVERAHEELRVVRERLERYALATLPLEVECEMDERMEALRDRTRDRLQEAVSAIDALRHEARSRDVPRDRIRAVSASVRACLEDIRGVVTRLRSSP